MKSDLSVGPPIDLVIYKKDTLDISQNDRLQFKTPFFARSFKKMVGRIRNLFGTLPKFDWENESD